MSRAPSPKKQELLTKKQQADWRFDVQSFRDLLYAQACFPLFIGDDFNALKQRWGDRMPQLAREAGVSYHAARRYAQVAEVFPPDSRLRQLKLPYSILRLLAPLEEKQRWAEQAWYLKQQNRLRVRDFAAMLEQAGLRKPRPPRVPRCAHCSGEAPDHPERVRLHRAGKTEWFCGDPCFSARFAPPTATPPSALPTPHSLETHASARDSESQPTAGPIANRPRKSQSLPTNASDPRVESQSPNAEPTPRDTVAQSPPAHISHRDFESQPPAGGTGPRGPASHTAAPPTLDAGLESPRPPSGQAPTPGRRRRARRRHRPRHHARPPPG